MRQVVDQVIVNLFRRNYTDYKNPGSVNLKTTVQFAIELYDTNSQEIVWSMPYTSNGETNIGLLIDRTAETVVARLNRAKMIAN